MQRETERSNTSWDCYYLIDALYWSSKSHDPQTKCGAVIVAPDNTPLSHGYNGFIRGADDSLPNTRPNKYPFMIHAEHNALLNCLRNGKSTLGATVYVTASPCLSCWQFMWQAGIVRVVYSNISTPKMVQNQEYEANLLLLKNSTKNSKNRMRVKFIDKNDLREFAEDKVNYIKGHFE